MESPSHYEFTEQENGIVSDLASRLGCLGAFMVFLGVIYGATAVLGGLASWLAPAQPGQMPHASFFVPVVVLTMFGTIAFIFLVTGAAMRRAYRSFGAIVSTRDDDIGHLMGALGQLAVVYKVWTITLGIGMLALLVSLVAGLLTGGGQS